MSWQPFSTAPTNGTKIDVWCLPPDRRGQGARFTDVQMRGDKSGFGFVVHYRDRTEWHYLDARGDDPIYPEWVPMWWMPTPAGPGEATAPNPFDPKTITVNEVKEYRERFQWTLMEAKHYLQKRNARDALFELRAKGTLDDKVEFLLNQYEEKL